MRLQKGYSRHIFVDKQILGQGVGMSDNLLVFGVLIRVVEPETVLFAVVGCVLDEL